MPKVEIGYCHMFFSLIALCPFRMQVQLGKKKNPMFTSSRVSFSKTLSKKFHFPPQKKKNWSKFTLGKKKKKIQKNCQFIYPKKKTRFFLEIKSLFMNIISMSSSKHVMLSIQHTN
jgi:hypothetical protein